MPTSLGQEQLPSNDEQLMVPGLTVSASSVPIFSLESTMTSKSKRPLPLSDILRDLALLRASGHDTVKIFKESSDTTTPSSDSLNSSVESSYNYIATVRAALKLSDSGKLETEGKKIDEVRSKYEELAVCYLLFLSSLFSSGTM